MASRPGFTHFNKTGEVHMVDIGDKAVTARTAVAEGRIVMSPGTLEMIRSGGSGKGDVLGIARTAGIMASKKTSDLIPLCHPLMLTNVDIEFHPDHAAPALVCRVTVRTMERTGVEMEALTAVQVALLTVYDMCKAVDRGMEITSVRLMHKAGGRSGTWDRQDEQGS